jgi:hypothetical protein
MNGNISSNLIAAITVAVAAYLQKEQAAGNDNPVPVDKKSGK